MRLKPIFLLEKPKNLQNNGQEKFCAEERRLDR